MQKQIEAVEAWVADLQKIGVCALLLIAVGFAIIFSYAGRVGSGLPMMAAMACVAAGASIGFLFGIPKTSADNSGKTDGHANNGVKDSQLQTNTNLEQISDWLTKILVGAGFVQFRELITFFRDLAGKLASEMPVQANSKSFAVFLILYFLILGFLVSYLLTRLYLPGAVTRASEQKLRQVESQMQEITSKIANIFESDPNKGSFGGKSTVNDRTLTAKVWPDENSNENFIVDLEVKSSDPKAPLQNPVVFYLHPTFSPSSKCVGPVNGVAKLQRVAWGAFTVGIEIADEDTRLELDLSELPDAPEKFKNR